MTYYKTYEYTERYFIRFRDVDENLWRISIQDPLFDGTATELTGAEFPIEWQGEGNEKQDEVVWGSTGTLRILCMPGQESIFSKNNLFPTEINDRRIQVLREMSDDQFGIYWQGFIEPSMYNQDFDISPIEVELPIVSAIAASKYFELPGLDGTHDFETATNIWALLAYSIDMLCCDYVDVFTNKHIYEDFNGNVSYDSLGRLRHWSEGRATSLDFYELSEGYTKPLTVYDVLERICYPYGKIYECSRTIVIAINWKKNAGDNARWYKASIYELDSNDEIDYDNIDTSPQRFSEDNFIDTVNLNNIETAGTSNTRSIVPPPIISQFTNDINGENTIFELTEDYLLPTLPEKYDSNLIFEKVFNNGSNIREHYKIDSSNVDVSAFTRGGEGGDAIDGIEVETNAYDQNTSYPFCRVAEMEGTDVYNMKSSIKTPLAFLFDIGQASGDSLYTIKFNVNRPIITNYLFNNIKLSIKAYSYDNEGALENLSLGNEHGAVTLAIKDVNEGKWLSFTGNRWQWVGQHSNIIGSELTKEGDDYILRFNEDRSQNDFEPHVLQLELRGLRVSGEYQFKLYAIVKLEYVSSQYYFTDRKLYEIKPPTKQIGTRRTSASNGDKLDIDFKTKCLRSHYFMPTALQHLSNSFCDAQKYIDMQERKMIEIDDAQFERYSGINGYFDFVTRLVTVVDGTEVYIPVSVGMNPRMNTLKLILVSTNVTQ